MDSTLSIVRRYTKGLTRAELAQLDREAVSQALPSVRAKIEAREGNTKAWIQIARVDHIIKTLGLPTS
jgi:hypothetical protein